VADHVVEREITDLDAENEIAYPMLGYLPGLGRFPAEANISLSETIQGAHHAELMVSGETARIGRIGLTVGLTPAQSQLLSIGDRVEFDGTSAVGYGSAASRVFQVVRAARMSRNDAGITTLEFELGGQLSPLGELQTQLGGANRLVVKGDFDVSCTVSGPEGMRWLALQDPRLETDFCQQLVAKFGMTKLAAQQ